MDEQQTTTRGEGQPTPGRARKAQVGRRRIWLGAAVAVVVVAGILVWEAVGGSDSPTQPAGPIAESIEPIALSAQGLRTLARKVKEPIYWAGPRAGYVYELTRTTDGNVYIRYLPDDVAAGAEEGKHLIVATYPFLGAFEALEKAAGANAKEVPGGGIASVDPKAPNSVHLAFRNVDFQVEVFDPSPRQALEVATSGTVRPVK